MHEGKYSAVIGLKEPVAPKIMLGTKNSFSTNHSAIFSVVHQTTKVRQTTV